MNGGKRVPMETREALLRALAAPVGSLTVARRPVPGGDDVIVVRMTTAGSVPPERRLAEFEGFAIEYEETGPAHAGRW
jgi:hypothetical protein